MSAPSAGQQTHLYAGVTLMCAPETVVLFGAPSRRPSVISLYLKLKVYTYALPMITVRR